jgi:hypothetical protein
MQAFDKGTLREEESEDSEDPAIERIAIRHFTKDGKDRRELANEADGIFDAGMVEDCAC